jgi:hypothetical protein
MKGLLFLLTLLSFSINARIPSEKLDFMIDQMVKDNVISKSEADKVKLKHKLSQANNQSLDFLGSRLPASDMAPNLPITEMNDLDLDQAQFKNIELETKKLNP